MRIAIGHPCVGAGGSEARVMNLLELLQEENAVDLITTLAPDWARLNAFYQTNVRPEKVRVRLAPLPCFLRGNQKAAALRGAFYQRFARRVGQEYDVAISAYNFTDWGSCPMAIQFIADFVWNWDYNCRQHPELRTRTHWKYRESGLRRLYLACSRFIYPHDVASECTQRGNTIIANSKWTRQVLLAENGIACHQVIYPPVRSEGSPKPWQERKNAFVSIGRIAPEKRILEQVEVIEQLRQRGHEVELHLMGAIHDDDYGQQVQRACAHKPYIRVLGPLFGSAKWVALHDCRYALHTCPNEAFGITIAEFVQAGCIPFIPNGGGQTEIVPFDVLQFQDRDTAVQKICAVLSAPAQQRDLQQQLAGIADRFRASAFQRDVTELLKTKRVQPQWGATKSQ